MCFGDPAQDRSRHERVRRLAEREAPRGPRASTGLRALPLGGRADGAPSRRQEPTRDSGVDELARAYRAGRRIVVPTAGAFDDTGRALRELRDRGVEVRRASLVNDVLIAQSARAVGATVITRDRGYEKLKAVLDFSLHVIVN
jgi:hypothetical protein